MSRKQLEKLRADASGLKNSPAKVAILEEAVRLADSLNDIDDAFSTRLELVRAATFSGMAERALVVFSWCLAKSKQEPERFQIHSLIWMYKWVLGTATDFYRISLKQIRGMQSEFESRLKQHGYGLRSYYKLRMDNANEMGLRQEAQHFEHLWKLTSRDSMADCFACEQDTEVESLVRANKYSSALKAARPIVLGKLACGSIPCQTYWKLMIVRLTRGELTLAGKLFAVGYPLAVGKPDYLIPISWHLCYLTRVLDIGRGLELIERHLPIVSRTTNPAKRMTFFSFAANFFERLADENSRPRKVRIPEILSIYRKSNLYAPKKLCTWFGEQANGLAQLFNVRNGNRYISWELDRGRALGLNLTQPDYMEFEVPMSAALPFTKEPATKSKQHKKSKQTENGESGVGDDP